MKNMNMNKYNLDGSINYEGDFDMQAAGIDVIEIDITDVDSMVYASEMHNIDPDDFKTIRDHYGFDALETQADMIMVKSRIAARSHRAARQTYGKGLSHRSH